MNPKLRWTMTYAAELVWIAIVAALLLLFFRPLPAKAAEFVVRPATSEVKPAAVEFVVKAAPAGQLVVPGGKIGQLWWVKDAQGNIIRYEWRYEQPAVGVPAVAPFVEPAPSSTRTINATSAVGSSTSLAAGWAGGVISIGVPAGTSGYTNCGTGGCSVPTRGRSGR